ncbi:MAG: PIN domain-containing protein [Dehalococcoidia bacterium]|nr:PIN domain-containing protein [Dehalococcoidia bacterium]
MTRHLCDVNVWLALLIDHHALANPVRSWFETVDDPGSLLVCRATQQSLLRLLTTPAVFTAYGSSPLDNQQAWQVYEAVLADERVAYLGTEPPGLDRYWRQFTNRPTASPKLWMDAYLGAFALAGGYALITTDSAFRQFSEVQVLILGG